MRTFAERGALFALILLTAYVIGSANDRAVPQVAAIGAPAPDVVALAGDGTRVSLASARGHPVWVTFFSSWCSYCRAENPDIEAVYEEQIAHGGDLVLLGVAVGETTASAKEYARVSGLAFPVAPDPDESVARRYAVLAFPTHVFVDRDGTVREIHIGTLPPDAMRAAVAAVGGSGR